MDFFKSVFSDDPLPFDDLHPDAQNDGVMAPGRGASKSESVNQNYRRDLEELGSGLKKETAVIREVASRAIKDFPGSLKVGASVAQDK
ncbi:hypothetical protein DVH24_031982 [Malus domestica]|uniref:Uncharacterized protein n=1 Tax=Malus domestica TaxID=3750 RepID=A0A498J4K3_MALDO|nr:hypothetical protein DVH24_031982 [Malus domestica]